MHRNDRLLAFLILSLWIGLFTAGILVDTTPYRNWITYRAWEGEVPTKHDKYYSFKPTLFDRIAAWPIVLTLYSVPNLLYLCILSAQAGLVTRRINRRGNGIKDDDSYAGAALIGFLLYLAFIAGLVSVASTAEFIAPTGDTYLRRATSLSVVSFMLTYEPRLIVLLSQRLTQFAESTISGSSSKSSQDNEPGP